jgi:hypothetical protein
MHSRSRVSIALLLTIAFAAAPIAADYCAAMCEAARTPGAPAPEHAHHLHHAATRLASIGQAPQPCGHEHHRIVGTEGANSLAPQRTVAASAAVVPAVPAIGSAVVLVHDVQGSSSPPGRSLRTLAVPLRV